MRPCSYIFFYEDEAEQLLQLKRCLNDFKGRGYRPSEITILSFVKDSDSAAKRLVESGTNLRPVWQFGSSIGYGTIHAFKGLENKIIILTDVLVDDPEHKKDLFYTGMTRCTESVRVLCAKESQQTLATLLVGGDET